MAEKSRPRVYTVFYKTPMTLFYGVPDTGEWVGNLMNRLRGEFPDIEFVGEELYNFDAMDPVFKAEEDESIDGILSYDIDLCPSGPRWYNRDESFLAPMRKKPFIWATPPSVLYPMGYVGMDILNTAMRENLPMISVQSSRFGDVSRGLNLIKALHHMKESKILAIGCLDNMDLVRMLSQEQDGAWRLDPEENVERLRERFGTEIIFMTAKEFKDRYYDAISEKEAEAEADRVTKEAINVTGPTREEIVNHARWIPATRNAVRDLDVDGVMVYELLTELSAGIAKPCMAMCELKDEGIPMAAMGCLDSMVTQLLMGYVTGRAGFTNDTLIDTSRGAALACYCCGPRRWEGPDSTPVPYEIRHCCAGGSTYANDVHEHQGKLFTSVRIGIEGDLIVTHQGKLAGRIHREVSPAEWGDWKEEVIPNWKQPVSFSEEQMGCQNRYVIETDAETAWKNFVKYWDRAGHHRTLYLGDWRKEIRDLATFTGLPLVEEDRD